MVFATIWPRTAMVCHTPIAVPYGPSLDLLRSMRPYETIGVALGRSRTGYVNFPLVHNRQTTRSPDATRAQRTGLVAMGVFTEAWAVLGPGRVLKYRLPRTHDSWWW